MKFDSCHRWSERRTHNLAPNDQRAYAGSERSMALLQSRRGHVTCTAFTGPDALTTTIAFKPDVVLLDIGLLGMGGFDVARQLRTMPDSENILISAMSGYGSAEDRAAADDSGFDDYIVKPIDISALQELLVKHSRCGLPV